MSGMGDRDGGEEGEGEGEDQDKGCWRVQRRGEGALLTFVSLYTGTVQ